MNHENKKIAFIGGGMVAEAMIRGMILTVTIPETYLSQTHHKKEGSFWLS